MSVAAGWVVPAGTPALISCHFARRCFRSCGLSECHPPSCTNGRERCQRGTLEHVNSSYCTTVCHLLSTASSFDVTSFSLFVRDSDSKLLMGPGDLCTASTYVLRVRSIGYYPALVVHVLGYKTIKTPFLTILHGKVLSPFF